MQSKMREDGYGFNVNSVQDIDLNGITQDPEPASGSWEVFVREKGERKKWRRFILLKPKVDLVPMFHCLQAFTYDQACIFDPRAWGGHGLTKKRYRFNGPCRVWVQALVLEE